MRETPPATVAPEICVDVMSKSTTWAEAEEKRTLYLDAGAEEGWFNEDDGLIHLFGPAALDPPPIAPDCPSRFD